MQLSEYMARVNKYQGPILGFSILMVVINHSEISFPSGPLSYLFNLMWQMDIFFFLSGMGLYLSFTKDEKLLPFYQRRISRVYPPVLPVLIVYELSILLLYGKMGILKEMLPILLKQVAGNFSLLGWFASLDNQFNWYVSALLLFYLIAPMLAVLVKNAEASRKKLGILLGFLCVTQICFFGNFLLIAYSRTIPFLLGMIAADLVKRGKEVKLNVPIMVILFVVGNLLSYYGNGPDLERNMYYGLCWYPSTIVLPGALYLLPLVFEWIAARPWLRWLGKALNVLGGHSLEAYLINVLACDLFVRWHMPMPGNAGRLMLAVMECAVAVLYGKLLERCYYERKRNRGGPLFRSGL